MRPHSLPSVFTAFVRRQQGGETPDADLLHDAWSGLRAVLGGEMKRRGLWQSSPCYLGVYGYERWDAGETVGDPMAYAWCHARAPQSALAELLTDCWAYIFSDRMRSLKRHLEDKGDIDGLVLRNVKNFLHERQREHDPVGFRIFEQLKGALADAVSRQALYVLGGDPRIRNNTVFGFAPATEHRLPSRELGPIVVRWNDELLPDLVTARGRLETAALERLGELLLELPRHGIACFLFKDLVDPLKNDARQRWATFLALRQVPPEHTVESRQSFEHLTRCVSTAIERLEVDRRTRRYLSTLWEYLRHRQGYPGGAGDHNPLDEETADDLPSHRQLSQRLQIPRERLPMLFATLQQLVSRHRSRAAE